MTIHPAQMPCSLDDTHPRSRGESLESLPESLSSASTPAAESNPFHPPTLSPSSTWNSSFTQSLIHHEHEIILSGIISQSWLSVVGRTVSLGKSLLSICLASYTSTMKSPFTRVSAWIERHQKVLWGSMCITIVIFTAVPIVIITKFNFIDPNNSTVDSSIVDTLIKTCQRNPRTDMYGGGVRAAIYIQCILTAVVQHTRITNRLQITILRSHCIPIILFLSYQLLLSPDVPDRSDFFIVLCLGTGVWWILLGPILRMSVTAHEGEYVLNILTQYLISLLWVLIMLGFWWGYLPGKGNFPEECRDFPPTVISLLLQSKSGKALAMIFKAWIILYFLMLLSVVLKGVRNVWEMRRKRHRLVDEENIDKEDINTNVPIVSTHPPILSKLGFALDCLLTFDAKDLPQILKWVSIYIGNLITIRTLTLT